MLSSPQHPTPPRTRPALRRTAVVATALLPLLAVAAGSAAAAPAPPQGVGEGAAAQRAAVERAAAGPASAQRAAVERAAAGVLRAGAPGVLVGVREQGGGSARTWSVRRGLGDVRARQPLDRAARFRIGSVTKTFVATTVLELVGERRLALDDTLERWLPGVLPRLATDRITLRMLLNHTSGVPDPTERLAADPRPLIGRDVTPAVLTATAERMRPTGAPGARWSYSNANYWLLAMVVERVTGRSYAREIERRIVDPLRLAQTRMPIRATSLPRPFAHGYARDDDGRPVDVTPLDASWASSSGGIVSTTGDLNRFTRALLSGRLLEPAELAEMKRGVRVPPAAEGFERYGLGLTRARLSCGVVLYGHSGGMLGFTTRAVSTPDGRRQLTAMANVDGSERIERALSGVVEAYFCPRG